MAEKRWRPPAEQRWTNDRQDAVRIGVRTEFLYSDSPPRVQPDGSLLAAHAFSRGGKVVASDVPTSSRYQQGIVDHLWRAVAAFGDDADLVIEVRRRESSNQQEDPDV